MKNTDIVVKIHLVKHSLHPIHLDILEHVATQLVKAVYPKVEEVGFVEGSPTIEGVNALQIRAPMDEGTKHQLEIALQRIFNQKFEVSFGDTHNGLNRQAEIGAVTQKFISSL